MTLALTTPSGPVQFSSSVRLRVYWVSVSIHTLFRHYDCTYLASLARRGCRELVVGVDVEARRPAGAVARAVAGRGGAGLDIASDLEVNVAVGRRSGRNQARGQEAHGQRDGAGKEPHVDDDGSR